MPVLDEFTANIESKQLKESEEALLGAAKGDPAVLFLVMFFDRKFKKDQKLWLKNKASREITIAMGA